jgi:general secretion pathway protein B
MSFILDALRKSETERQRSALPNVSQVPFAVARPRLPGWALALIVALGVAVLALGAAWWTTLRTESAGDSVAEAPPAARPTTSMPLEIPARTPPPERVEPTDTGEEELPRSLATLVEGSGVTRGDAPSRSEAPTARREPPSGRSEAGAGPAVPEPRAALGPTLPSPAALAAEGVTVPELKLQLHVYYRDRPGDRFVIVNGARYREGEQLAEGPRVVAIEEAGAVLAYQSRQFFLTPE